MMTILYNIFVTPLVISISLISVLLKFFINNAMTILYHIFVTPLVILISLIYVILKFVISPIIISLISAIFLICIKWSIPLNWFGIALLQIYIGKRNDASIWWFFMMHPLDIMNIVKLAKITLLIQENADDFFKIMFLLTLAISTLRNIMPITQHAYGCIACIYICIIVMW